MPDCLFCKIVAGSVPCHKLYENDQVIVFLDIFPVGVGHCLVVPKVHSTDLRETSNEDACAMMSAIKKVTPALLQAVKGDGYNLGMNNGDSAGQDIFHTHLHIMPRKTGTPREFEKTKGDQEELAALAEKVRGLI